MDIKKITKIKNVKIKNTHNDFMYPSQDILEIEFKNGSIKRLDLLSQKDMTDVDYFEVIETIMTKKDIIYEESDD